MTSTQTTTRLLFTVLLLLSVWSVNASAQNREPPTMLGQWYNDNNTSLSYQIIPDQTGNGYGEIIGILNGPRKFKLIYGNNDFYLPAQGDVTYDTHDIGIATNYVGRFLPNRADFVVTSYFEEIDDTIYYATRLHEMGDSIGTPGTLLKFARRDIRARSAQDGDFYVVPINIGGGKPGDLNGDGFHDLILIERKTNELIIFFGGDSIKTEPDVRLTIIDPNARNNYTFWISTGFDVNGDGYDDLLVRNFLHADDDSNGHHIRIFLGGDPMDTEPVIHIGMRHYYDEIQKRITSLESGNQACLLQDLNGDGYDDWGLAGIHNVVGNKFPFLYIFYGGEELSDRPDLEVPVSTFDEKGYGGFVGGDFNGDGLGDILMFHPGYVFFGDEYGGDFTLHFGSRWGLSSYRDLFVRSTLEYGAEHKGLNRMGVAVGKFNRDDADDFILSNFNSTRFVVLGGNPDWEVSVAEHDSTINTTLEIECFPNPFNDVLNVRVKVPFVQQVRVQVYDIQGRVVYSFPSSAVSDEKVWVWNYSASGVYFVKINNQHQTQTVKVVCIK